jgi:hypothetical protein
MAPLNDEIRELAAQKLLDDIERLRLPGFFGGQSCGLDLSTSL